MSHPRYDWWPYVKGMIRRYPALRRMKDELQAPSVTVSYNGHPRGSGVSDPTSAAAMRQLSRTNEREIEAVERAIAATRRKHDGRDRLLLIDRVFWSRTHTLEGAAQLVPCGIATAKRWHGDFIRMVAKYYGLFE